MTPAGVTHPVQLYSHFLRYQTNKRRSNSA